MTIYLDSSVMLRYLLSGDKTIRAIAKDDSVLSSELLEIECKRVLQRERLEGNLDDARYAVVIGALDALHLATALAYRERFSEPLSMLSFDKQLALCASASGIPSYRP